MDEESKPLTTFTVSQRYKDNNTKSILDNTGKSEISENPVKEQVDNFLNIDGEVDQPIYEGPQTWSHTKNLMMANILIDQLFDIQSGKVCDNIIDIVEISMKPVESVRDLVL